MRSHIIGLLLAFIFSFSFLKAKSQSDRYDWSLKFGGGSSWLLNNNKTTRWFGNSKGSFFFLGAGYKNVHINATFKYFNENTKTDLTYDDKILPLGAQFNIVFFNLTTSYEYEVGSNFFVEPYIGYIQNNITSNIVHPNGDELDIRNTSGITLGLNFIKHIKFFNGAFFSPFIGINYDIINFKKISSDLDNNAKGISFGVMLKAIDTKYSSQNKNSKNKPSPPPPF